LRAAKGFEITDHRKSTCPVQTLLGARKGAGKSVSRPSRVKHLKQARRDLLIGGGRLRRQPGGAAIVARAPSSISCSPADAAPAPGIDRRSAKLRPAAVDVSFPEIEKFDKLRRPV